MSHTEGVVSPREQRLRDLRRIISEIGIGSAEKTEAHELLEELEKPGQTTTLSGYEASHLPWLRKFVKHVCK